MLQKMLVHFSPLLELGMGATIIDCAAMVERIVIDSIMWSGASVGSCSLYNN